MSKSDIKSKPGIKPIASFVLAEADQAEAKTASGLYLPENAQEKPKTATVAAIGPEVKKIKAGDRIIYESYSGTDVKYQGKEYVLVAEDKILATVS